MQVTFIKFNSLKYIILINIIITSIILWILIESTITFFLFKYIQIHQNIKHLQ